MNGVRLTVENILVCDDIRSEDNGKAIIIGVYTGSISPRRFPAKLKLAFWLVGKVEGQGEFKLDVRIRVTSDSPSPSTAEAILGMSGAVSEPISDPQDFQFAIGSDQLFEFPGPGTLLIATRVGDEEFRDILKKQILLAPAISSGEATQLP